MTPPTPHTPTPLFNLEHNLGSMTVRHLTLLPQRQTIEQHKRFSKFATNSLNLVKFS